MFVTGRMVALGLVTPAVLLVVLSAACGADQRVSVERYTEICADGVISATQLIDPEEVSWGAVLEIGEASIERLQAIAPPAALDEFHQASLRTLMFVASVAREQPAGERANPLVLGFDAVRIATQLKRAVDDLPADLRRTLRQAGCL